MRKRVRYLPYHPKRVKKVPRSRVCVRIVASGLSLVLCAGAAAGQTYAWFSDSGSESIVDVASAAFVGSTSTMDNAEVSGPVLLELAQEDIHYFNLTASGTASKGYCKITVRDTYGGVYKEYYVSPIQQGSSVQLNVEAPSGYTLDFAYNWGSPEESIPAEQIVVPYIPFTAVSEDAMSAYVEVGNTPNIAYTVPEGTSLRLLAGYYGVKKGDILTYNGLEALTDGMTIRIPFVDPASAPEPYAPPNVHVVAEGETLTIIAELHGIPVRALCLMNNLSETSVIGVGQKLLIPYVYDGEDYMPTDNFPLFEEEDQETGSEVTEEETTEGESTEGETTEEEATESESTEDETTEGETTESETTEDETIESETTEDESTESETTDGETTEGEPTESESTEGETTEDETTESETTEEETTESETTESETTESETTEDETTEGETTDGETTEGEPTESESTEGETTEDETTEGEATEGETTKSETTEDEETGEDTPALSSGSYSGPATYVEGYVPLYYQDDYPDILYGQGTVKTSGCSVTSLAMVATALTGHEYMPDELADYFGDEGVNNMDRLERGSNALQLPYKKSVNWDETWQALQEGKIVIALMEQNSMFTDSQHFIVLTGLNDSGKIMVNDSSKANYDHWQLKNGFENGFSPSDILLGYSGAWIYDPEAMPEEVFIYQESRIDRSNFNYPEISLTYEERELLAKVIWAEARGESAAGQQAIAEVVFNRMLSDQFSDTLNDVIYGEGQFRSVEVLEDATPWAAQYRAIERALHGKRILPKDVVYFATYKINPDVWGVIGNHIFCYEQ